MITELTPQQQERLLEIRQEWYNIGVNTQPADWVTAEAAISGIYEFSGFQKPKSFIHLSSPFAAKILYNILEWFDYRIRQRWIHFIVRDSRSQLSTQIQAQVEGRLSAKIWDQLNNFLARPLNHQLQDLVWSQVSNYLTERVLQRIINQFQKQTKKVGDNLHWQFQDYLVDQINNELSNQFGEQIVSQINMRVEKNRLDVPLRSLKNLTPTSIYPCDNSYGQQEAPWISYSVFLREIGVKYDEEANRGLDLMIQIAKSCHWWYPFEEFCIIIDRPESIVMKDLRLHSESGPALRFRDGYSLWAIEGVKVDEKIVMAPETITLQQIENETNLEVQRLMIERYGAGKYLMETGAKLLDASSLKLAGSATRALFEDKNGNKFLVGTDGSTKRVYHMAVPRTVMTCAQAHAQICGFNENRLIAEC